MLLKPKIAYDYDEGVWYVEYQSVRTWVRSRAWKNVVPVAMSLARGDKWDLLPAGFWVR